MLSTEAERAAYWRHMRAIMYQPGAVWLATSKATGRRWLTDQFVMLDITDSEEFRELPDGAYKLTVVNGPEPREADISLVMDTYLGSMDLREWYLAEPTMWSVIEDYQGKAQLWVTEGGAPALLGEPTWAAIKRYYPECKVQHSWRGNSVFRFWDAPAHIHDDDGTTEGCPGCFVDPTVFAYAAGIKMPEGQGKVADSIVQALE